MVRPTQKAPSPPPVSFSFEIAEEQLKALLGLYDRLNELMGDWGDRSKSASDGAVVAVAEYYQSLCRELDLKFGEFQRSVPTTGSPLDLTPLVAARRHLALVTALKAANVLEAERDIREGRTLTSEQMRRELRNPTH